MAASHNRLMRFSHCLYILSTRVQQNPSHRSAPPKAGSIVAIVVDVTRAQTPTALRRVVRHHHLTAVLVGRRVGLHEDQAPRVDVIGLELTRSVLSAEEPKEFCQRDHSGLACLEAAAIANGQRGGVAAFPVSCGIR